MLIVQLEDIRMRKFTISHQIKLPGDKLTFNDSSCQRCFWSLKKWVRTKEWCYHDKGVYGMQG